MTDKDNSETCNFQRIIWLDDSGLYKWSVGYRCGVCVCNSLSLLRLLTGLNGVWRLVSPTLLLRNVMKNCFFYFCFRNDAEKRLTRLNMWCYVSINYSENAYRYYSVGSFLKKKNGIENNNRCVIFEQIDNNIQNTRSDVVVWRSTLLHNTSRI